MLIKYNIPNKCYIYNIIVYYIIYAKTNTNTNTKN